MFPLFAYVRATKENNRNEQICSMWLYMGRKYRMSIGCSWLKKAEKNSRSHTLHATAQESAEQHWIKEARIASTSFVFW